jgi:hypothetical protein
MALVTAEVTWLRWLLEDFGVSVSIPIPLLSDSIGAINIARDSIKHELTKHIGVDAHFIRSHVQDGVVAFQYVLSELQLAYFFTCFQSYSYQISSQMLKLTPIISFTSPNLVLLIHHEFEGVLDMY